MDHMILFGNVVFEVRQGWAMLVLGWVTACSTVQLCYCDGLFPQVPLARNCKLATELRTCKSMWEMRRVPQSYVNKIASFLIYLDGK